MIPEALHRALVNAVGNHSVSELRKCFDELEALEGPGGQLARELRTFGDRYDMAGIAKVLQKTPHE